MAVEGVLAIHKPQGITSAQVIRDVQERFNPSDFFKPWMQAERARMAKDNSNKSRRRRDQKLKLKMGHGGTLDPLATGVLVLGIGSGTKELNKFLECTKSYEAVVLFGAATDTYDRLGKVIGRQPYGHITRDLVETALEKFKGKIMQKPPIYSALKVNGKKLYEYAREGKEVPIEIQERPVEVTELELVEWLEPGTHEHRIPEDVAEKEERDVAVKLLDISGTKNAESTVEEDPEHRKRKREEEDDSAQKKVRAESSTGPILDSQQEGERGIVMPPDPPGGKDPEPGDPVMSGAVPVSTDKAETPIENTKPLGPPAARIRMTVTSGFYVRSLCHDLGAAVGSFALMSELIRTRQGDFELGKNVFEYSDLEKGEAVWAPKVSKLLEDWNTKTGSERKRSTSPQGQKQTSETLI